MAVDDLWVDDMTSIEVGATRVLIVRLDDGVHAFENRCAHLGLPLDEGRLERCRLICAAHGWTYDARTGRGINPQTARLRTFPVRIEHGRIFVDVEAGDAP
jgi:toluene monooxygenase system ferredoxin subunit